MYDGLKRKYANVPLVAGVLDELKSLATELEFRAERCQYDSLLYLMKDYGWYSNLAAWRMSPEDGRELESIESYLFASLAEKLVKKCGCR